MKSHYEICNSLKQFSVGCSRGLSCAVTEFTRNPNPVPQKVIREHVELPVCFVWLALWSFANFLQIVKFRRNSWWQGKRELVWLEVGFHPLPDPFSNMGDLSSDLLWGRRGSDRNWLSHDTFSVQHVIGFPQFDAFTWDLSVLVQISCTPRLQDWILRPQLSCYSSDNDRAAIVRPNLKIEGIHATHPIFGFSWKNRKSGSTGTINGNNPFCHTQAVADAVDILTLFAWHSGVPYMLMDSPASNGNSLPRRTACRECVGLVHWAEW